MTDPVEHTSARTLREQNESFQSELRLLRAGGGGGTLPPMEGRVSKLEAQVEYLDRTLSSIDGKLDKVNDRLMQMPTKADLSSWKLQWTALALAAVAIIIGGIVGGLAWIQPQPTPPAPTVIQLPATSAQP